MPQDVETVPERVAHVAYALIAAQDQHGMMPVTAEEVCIYDSEAYTVGATRAALERACAVGLAARSPMGRRPVLWYPTIRALELREALENRSLRDIDET